MAAHPWKLVGPWYRWPRPGLPADGRLSTPEIQKYAHPRFVSSFMAEPQRSLMFDPDRDFRSRPSLIAPENVLVRRIGGMLDAARGWAGQKVQSRVLFRQSELQRARLVSSGLLKLYQPVHERFYVVVAELHCDTAGFPSPAREAVCSAGFTMRRRSTVIDGADAGVAERMLSAVEDARVALAELQGEGPLKPAMAALRLATIAAMQADGSLAEETRRRAEALAASQATLRAWRDERGYGTVIQRWVGLDPTDPATKVGEWRDIPQGGADALRDGDLHEHVIPMRRAHADAADGEHDAHGRAIYFGVIPTAALQHDAAGNERFHDDDVYEIRCFVRRRRGDCLRLPGDGGCRGEVVWSAPTRPFCIAPAMDLDGMANRPVTIRMPDLQGLQGQIATAPDPSRFATLGFDQPQQLLPRDTEMPPSRNAPGPAAVCFFAIPLITIVALFLLNLFLPIILFVFNLWWMLALKFCIPPSVRIDAGLSAVLDAVLPGIDLAGKLDVDIDMPDGSVESLAGALAPAVAPLQPRVSLNLAESYALVDTAARTQPEAAQGRTGRFLEDAFYPRVRPVWEPRPAPTREAAP